MRMCRRLGAGGHGNVEVPVTSIKGFEATGAGSSTMKPSSDSHVGAFIGAASALIWTNTRVNFTLKRRTKALTISATWNAGYPNSPCYAGIFPGDFAENRAAWGDGYIVKKPINIERRSGRQGGTVTVELEPDTPLSPGDYCIYFFATPAGAGQVKTLPTEQVSITAKV